MSQTAATNQDRHKTAWDWIETIIRSDQSEKDEKIINAAPQRLQTAVTQYLIIRKARLLVEQEARKGKTKKCTKPI